MRHIELSEKDAAATPGRSWTFSFGTRRSDPDLNDPTVSNSAQGSGMIANTFPQINIRARICFC